MERLHQKRHTWGKNKLSCRVQCLVNEFALTPNALEQAKLYAAHSDHLKCASKKNAPLFRCLEKTVRLNDSE